MTTLEIESERERGARFPRVNWTAVAAITAIIGALLSLAIAGAGDYRKIGDRVTILETQRTNDTNRMERIENKIDRLLERK